MITLLLFSHAMAAVVSGVTVPDSVVLGGSDLKLNGAGVREEYLVDIYVGALYLPSPCQSGAEVIQSDIPKRLYVEFVFPFITANRLKNTLYSNFEKYPNLSEKSKTEMLAAFKWLPDFKRGETMVIDYVPSVGTTLLINGQVAGTSEGQALMKGMFTLFFGDKPNDLGFQQDLLGSSGQTKSCFQP